MLTSRPVGDVVIVTGTMLVKFAASETGLFMVTFSVFVELVVVPVQLTNRYPVLMVAVRVTWDPEA
jgi:hypothetical protein